MNFRHVLVGVGGIGVAVVVGGAGQPPGTGDRPIDQAQREFDRTTGRVVDQPTYELNRMQAPPRRDLEWIEQDIDRRQLIDRKQWDEEQRAREQAMTAAGGAGGRAAVAPAPGGGGPVVVMTPDKEALEAEVLEAVVAYERGTRQAGQEMASDPVKLRQRRRALGSELEHRLDRVLSHYAVRQVNAPDAAPVPAVPATRPAR